MTTIPLLAGMLASMLHVVSGPDHLAAVTPLIIESQRKAWRIGLAWALGHLTGMLLIGLMFLLFHEMIPIKTISKHSEELVALVLIGMGSWTFYRIYREPQQHIHPHIHTEGEPYIHIHKHTHQHSDGHIHKHPRPIRQNFISAFMIGVLHGLAGIAHFLLLLPVIGFSTRMEGVEYIVGSGLGTVVAMTAYALLLGSLADISRQMHDQIFFKGVRFAGGLFALVIGFYWLYLAL